MRYSRLLSLIFTVLICFAVSTGNLSATTLTTMDSPKEVALHDAMRKLWEDHITWTRIFIVSAAGDLPDKAAATERLLQNQVDIGMEV